jgi:hypothetical protein
MNCAKLLASTGWSCTPSGVRAIRAVAPFTLGINGQCAAFYIAQPSDDTFYLTDACETAVHAEQHGIVLSKKRMQALNSTSGVTLAQFDAEGSIVASGPIDEMQSALWDAAKLAIALSFKTDKWKPKFAQEKFQATVLAEFEVQLGAERIIRDAKVQGASGHTIGFPIGVKLTNGLISFVQPIALESGKINWAMVYQAHGKFFDVKAASDVDNRIAIIEDGAAKLEFGRVANFLSEAASVHTLSGTKDWSPVFA